MTIGVWLLPPSRELSGRLRYRRVPDMDVSGQFCEICPSLLQAVQPHRWGPRSGALGGDEGTRVYGTCKKLSFQAAALRPSWLSWLLDTPTPLCLSPDGPSPDRWMSMYISGGYYLRLVS